MLPSNYTVQKWWKEATVYQIYPASFKSTKCAAEADGWGDVRGMTEKVPYLKSLGVDVVWTSPVYKSPQVDMGYDIADYKSIDPRYGDISDVNELIKTLNDHNMKLIMDLVVTHTSNKHEWFVESSRSKDSPKRNWYIWKPPRGYDRQNGNPFPPNNWAQILNDSSSAWVWSDKTNEFYLALHTAEQPDLNWESPQVVDAVHDIMHFWLSRGVSGFRMDVINLISKDQSFPDAPVIEPNCDFQPGERFYTNGPRFHEFMKGIYDNVLSKYETLTVGEMPYVTDMSEIIKTVGSTAKELNMIFVFDHMEIQDVKTKGDSKWSMRDWELSELKTILSGWQRRMIEWDGWNTVFFECHDQARSVSRYVDDSDEFRERGAKALALLQTTLGGTLYLFQGQEIGMRNFPTDWDPESDYKDVESLNFWAKTKREHLNEPLKMKMARELLQKKARDHARTPMQWNSGPNAGFTAEDVKPWMRVNDDYTEVNVETQMSSNGKELSVWKYWQLALQNRKAHKDVFIYGDYADLDLENEQVFAYLRVGTQSNETWLIAINWTGTDISWEIPAPIKVDWVASSTLQRQINIEGQSNIKLWAWEGVLVRCR